MAGAVFRSYVAIGDSLSEGLGDFDFDFRRHHSGWTDRLAALLSIEAISRGIDFQYANLALRGSKLQRIMTDQLEEALRLQPDLVTIMAGSNDIFTRPTKLPALEKTFREGIQLLQAADCEVVIANTINPVHLRVFQGIANRASRLSAMLERIAIECGVRIIDVHGIESFQNLSYWAEDMVHFSGHGHVKVANSAAQVLGLTHRMPEAGHDEMHAPSRSLRATLAWVCVHVLPFIGRKIRGVTSGDGLQPKHSNLVPYGHSHFEVVAVTEGDFSVAA